jgi:hypothetical protein
MKVRGLLFLALYRKAPSLDGPYVETKFVFFSKPKTQLFIGYGATLSSKEESKSFKIFGFHSSAIHEV